MLERAKASGRTWCTRCLSHRRRIRFALHDPGRRRRSPLSSPPVRSFLANAEALRWVHWVRCSLLLTEANEIVKFLK